MLLIHPPHAGPVNRIFTPGAEELACYQGLLDAMAEAERQGTAAVAYQGAMVDTAMVQMAQRMSDFARALGVRR